MKTYIIDLDGTMYSGSTNIDGAREFIDYLHSKNLPYIFLTNNATRTKKQAKEHMLNLGFKNIREEDFFTSAMAAAKFIATNPDRLLANNGTFDIGNGAVIDMLEYASGVKAIKIGKPYQIILDILLDEKNLKKEDIVLVGDNLETDIKLGYDANIETIMVCSGVHTEKDIEKLKVYPTKIVKNLRELIK